MCNHFGGSGWSGSVGICPAQGFHWGNFKHLGDDGIGYDDKECDDDGDKDSSEDMSGLNPISKKKTKKHPGDWGGKRGRRSNSTSWVTIMIITIMIINNYDN